MVERDSGSRMVRVSVIILILVVKGLDAFFIRHSSSRKCLVARTDSWYSHASWGSLHAVSLDQNCLNMRAQFRFGENDVIHDKEMKGCFDFFYKSSRQYDILYLYETVVGSGTSCYYNRRFWQTSGGSLLSHLKLYHGTAANNYCVTPFSPSKYGGEYFYASLTCDQDNQQFTFGSITCDGSRTTDVSCPKDQVMFINEANYGGLSEMKTCGFNETSSCTEDVTCVMKDICDGQESCENVMVNNSLSVVDPCGVKSKYLYLDYQCLNKTVDVKEISGKKCSEPILEGRSEVPDSSFTSSGSREGYEAFRARLSSNSSWCAKCGGKPFLEIKFVKSFVLSSITTMGDNGTENRVIEYKLNYTVYFGQWTEAPYNKDTVFPGNKEGPNKMVTNTLDGTVIARAVRIVPVLSFGKQCMRVEICGQAQFPTAPRNLTVTNITSSTVTFTWSAPLDEGDGGVQGYNYEIKRQDSSVRNGSTVASSNTASEGELKPYTTYELSVVARNIHGPGELATVSFTTQEAAPSGPPLEIKVSTKNSTVITVSWQEPDKNEQNGVITRYTVCLSTSTTNTSTCDKEYVTTTKTLLIFNLKSATTYYVRVRAETKAGQGNYSDYQETKTNSKPLDVPTATTETTITFQLQEPTTGFSTFLVVAIRLPDDNMPKTSPNEYTAEQLLDYAGASASETPVPYIAARVNTTLLPYNETFVLGAGGNKQGSESRRKRRASGGDYFNGPLEVGNYYSVFQRFLSDKDGSYFSTDWSQPVKTGTAAKEEPSSSSSDSDTTVIVIIVVCAVVGILILVLVAVFIIRRRRNKQTKKAPRNNNVNAMEIISSDNEAAEDNANVAEQDGGHVNVVEDTTRQDGGHVIVAEENEGQDGDHDEVTVDNVEEAGGVYANQTEIEMQKKHEDIPISMLQEHILKLEKKKNFKDEFKQLPMGQHFDWKIAKLPCNKDKNRYGNIATYDHSRVILSGDKENDYINASYIDGITEKYYIATQGPISLTVNDFWRMVFEKKSPTIVMVTALVEIGKEKCVKYWPDEAKTYDSIQVKLKESRIFADHVSRVFILQKDGVEHEVKHFQFHSWPDHGVPNYPTQMLTFRSHVKSYHETKTGPMVVHCSAGVGRTGVFIAIDKLVDELDKKKAQSLNIFNVLQDLRSRRINMVQVVEQYIFIHTALLDHIKCGANEINSTNISIEIKKLSEQNSQGISGFTEKFQRLMKVSPSLNNVECDAALHPGNQEKNRSRSIYPAEKSRVGLQYITGCEDSDYINACYVDGYLGKDFFIATQTPLDKTINDFWRMITEKKVTTIVMLNQLRENDQEYPMFWPTEKSKPHHYGQVTVMFEQATKKDSTITRKFMVSATPDIHEGTVLRLIQYISWPDHGVPGNPDDVLALLSDVEESQRAGHKAPVVVVCSDGAGRTGTYITISNLIDRMKVVQVLDVFQAIKLIRARRPQFVENDVQLQFCYAVVEAMLKSYGEYSNFKDTDE